MTQAISVPARRFGELRVVGPICAAHFVSHYYMIMLAPLFAFVRADYGVSYTDLALALTAFNVVSAVLQTPVISRDSADDIVRTEVSCVIADGTTYFVGA